MNPLKVLKSLEDQSVNFVTPQKIGFFEARYVRRTEDYFIVYLSSQTGCNRGCKFCHLTATGQTAFVNASKDDFLSQAKQVFEHYLNQAPAKEVNFNFMARGEALANPNLLENSYSVLQGLSELALKHNLIPKLNISTIMPKTLGQPELAKIFAGTNATIYYSLYSLDPSFRRKWLPAAMDPYEALDALKKYQISSGKVIKLHWAFIEGENDSLETLEDIVSELNKRELICDFNLVRYNPYSPIQGKESPLEVLNRNLEFMKNNILGSAKLIERVGFDVKASCGMFVEKMDS